jgi:hypothetical protein
MFSDTVQTQLGFYVYRLIDPRNAETFYVGKGNKNRIFDHAIGVTTSNTDEVGDKIKRIREILNERLTVIHLVHRHGMSEETALQVEAALIDAYPGATNQIGGVGSDDYGVMNTQQIIARYEAPEVVFLHPVIILLVNKSLAAGEDIYTATRYAWRIDRRRAENAELVLAVRRGVVIGAFCDVNWVDATPDNFPWTTEVLLGRSGFNATTAPVEVAQHYLGHRIPDRMRIRGAVSAIRYEGFQ